MAATDLFDLVVGEPLFNEQQEFAISYPGSGSSPKKISYSPDLDVLLTYDERTSALKLFDSATMRCVRTTSLHLRGLKALLYVGHGRANKPFDVMMATTPAAMYAWKGLGVSGTRQPRLQQQCRIATQSPQTCLAWSSETELLYSGSIAGHISCWQLRNHFPIVDVFGGHTGQVNRLAAMPSSGMLASASVDRSVRVWDVASNRPRHVYKAHTAAVTAVSFSVSNRLLLSGGYDHKLFLYSPHEGSSTPVHALRAAHQHPIVDAFFGGESLPYFVSADSKGIIKFWDIRNLRCLHSVDARIDNPSLASCTPRHARIVALGRGPNAVSFVARTCAPAKTSAATSSSSKHRPAKTPTHSPAPGTKCSSSSNRCISTVLYNAKFDSFATTRARSLSVWNAESGRLMRQIDEFTDTDVTATCLETSQMKMFAGDRSGSVHMFEYSTLRLLRRLQTHEAPLLELVFQARVEALLSCSCARRGHLSVHEERPFPPALRASRHTKTVVKPGTSSPFTSVALSPTSGVVVAGDASGLVIAWASSRQAPLFAERRHDHRITAICFLSPMKLFASADVDGRVCLWMTRTMPVNHESALVASYSHLSLDGNIELLPVTAMAFEPRDSLLYTADATGLVQARRVLESEVICSRVSVRLEYASSFRVRHTHIRSMKIVHALPPSLVLAYDGRACVDVYTGDGTLSGSLGQQEDGESNPPWHFQKIQPEEENKRPLRSNSMPSLFGLKKRLGRLCPGPGKTVLPKKGVATYRMAEFPSPEGDPELHQNSGTSYSFSSMPGRAIKSRGGAVRSLFEVHPVASRYISGGYASTSMLGAAPGSSPSSRHLAFPPGAMLPNPLPNKPARRGSVVRMPLPMSRPHTGPMGSIQGLNGRRDTSFPVKRLAMPDMPANVSRPNTTVVHSRAGLPEIKLDPKNRKADDNKQQAVAAAAASEGGSSAGRKRKQGVRLNIYLGGATEPAQHSHHHEPSLRKPSWTQVVDMP